MNATNPIKRTSLAILSAASLLMGTAALAAFDTYTDKPATESTLQEKTKSATKETGRIVSDSWITTKVKSVLLADSLTKGFKISVKTFNHSVILSGSVDSQDTIDHAFQLASKVEGVAMVDTTNLKIR